MSVIHLIYKILWDNFIIRNSRRILVVQNTIIRGRMPFSSKVENIAPRRKNNSKNSNTLAIFTKGFTLLPIREKGMAKNKTMIQFPTLENI